MSETIKVGMADMKVCKEPDSLTTLGLGSCVGIALYDPVTKISGMIHIMLPDSTKIKNNDNIAKFADTGIPKLIDDVVALGASRNRLVAKIAGGAQMFGFGSTVSEFMQVGERNVEATKTILGEYKIPILASDTGLNYGRTIIFESTTGMLRIKAVGHQETAI